MKILITWKDRDGMVFDTTEATLAQFFDENPEHVQGCRTAIRDEIRRGKHVWTNFGITAEITKR